jgi:type II restriction enzyme
MVNDAEKREDIEHVIGALRSLSPIQVEVLTSIIEKFAEGQSSEHLRKDFLDEDAFEYFSTRLAAHHASSGVPLKKENFEHILEQSFKRAGHDAKRTDNMVHRGADLEVDRHYFSLKTEAARGLNPKSITISKLMEARWIRDLNGPEDAPGQVRERVLSHLQEYERIFMLRSYGDEMRVRYDLREIPKDVLAAVANLEAKDFGKITNAGGTSANVNINGRKAFRLVLDGSVEKITISGLDVDFCPLHAWWELGRPG